MAVPFPDVRSALAAVFGPLRSRGAVARSWRRSPRQGPTGARCSPRLHADQQGRRALCTKCGMRDALHKELRSRRREATLSNVEAAAILFGLRHCV